MEDKEFIEKLVKSRKLQSITYEDWEVYDLVEHEIYNQHKVRDLEVYFYGFDDETLGDSEILNYLEMVFYGTKIGNEGNKYSEEEIIQKLIKNFEIFIPHGINWYVDIMQGLLAHFSDKTYEIMRKQILLLSNKQREELGNELKKIDSGFFEYSDMNRIKEDYQNLIKACESDSI